MEREIIMVVDAPAVILEESEMAEDVLLKFYRALGWDSENHVLDPVKVRTTKEVYNQLYDAMFNKAPDAAEVGMFMINRGPGVDDGIPPGKVYLRDGWLIPIEPPSNGSEEGATQ